MELAYIWTTCSDGSCCCFTTRWSVALISLFSMMVCLADMYTFQAVVQCCEMKDYVECARHVLQWLFQVANMLLIVSTVMDNALLVSLYLWYTLSYVVLGLCVAILELLCRVLHEGALAGGLFATEVIFYFVLSRCLPIVNSFKQDLEVYAARQSFHRCQNYLRQKKTKHFSI